MSAVPIARDLALEYEAKLVELGRRLERTQHQLEETMRDLENAEKDLKGKRRRIQELERELNAARRAHPRFHEAEQVFDYWNETVKDGRAREFSGKRLKAVLARLAAGYDVESLKRAVDGARVAAFEKDGKRYDDLELICRDATKVDDFIERADLHQRRESVRARAVTGADRPDAAMLPPELALDGWVTRLQENPKLLERAREVKGWTPEVLQHLGVGWDRGRFTIPVRELDGELVNLLRYVPGGEPKLIALRGRVRRPWPAPMPDRGVILVEGEPDALSARSIGLNAVAVPGVGWLENPGHLELVDRWTAGVPVAIVFDCDEPGRKAAQTVARALADRPAHAKASIYDLGPLRADGYDVGDWIAEGGKPADFFARLTRVMVQPAPPERAIREPQPKPKGARSSDPAIDVLSALERHGLRWKVTGRDRYQSQCPAHADRGPSLSIRQVEGEDGPKVLLNCFAACETKAIIDALGLPWSALFGEGS